MNIPKIADAIGYIDNELHWKHRQRKGIIL